MAKVFLNKFGQVIAVLFFVSIIIFFTFRLLPGDPALLKLGMEPSPAALAALRHEMGLDQPLVIQYVQWLGHVFQGDLGKSALDGTPVLNLLIDKVPKSIELAVLGMLLSLLISIPIGVLASLYKNSWIDRLSRVLSLFGFSTPSYWLAILFMLFFSLKYQVLPAGGYVDFSESPIDHINFLILPVLTIGIVNAAQMFRFLRSGILEVIKQDYIRTARSKGLSSFIIVGKHIGRNAVPTLITVLGLNFSVMISGLVITEQIFQWPGLGWLMIQSILSRDYDIVQGAVLVSAVFIVLINFLTDIINAMLDPRIKSKSM